MNYPTLKKRTVPVSDIKKNNKLNDKVNYSNRGDALESDINATNDYYLANDIAVIHKKPTPITIVKVDYPSRNAAKITEAYFKLPSTTDYNGIYKGRYIDFEVKQISSSKTSFPFRLIHPHQIKHLSDVLKHGAICFLIIRICCDDKEYLLMAKDFLDYYNSTTRKSLSFKWIREKAYPIERSYIKPCDYLKVLDTYILKEE